jgi:hypothetical protein
MRAERYCILEIHPHQRKAVIMSARHLKEGGIYTAAQLRETAPHARGVESTATIRSLMAALSSMPVKPPPAPPRPDPLDVLLAEAEQPVDSAAHLGELLRTME